MADILAINRLERGYQKPGTANELEYFEERLSKRKIKEREEQKMNEFLHTSLRSSDRLRALERSKKMNYKMNAAYEPEETIARPMMEDIDIPRLLESLCQRKYNKNNNISRSELDWLQQYVRTEDFQKCYKTSMDISEIFNRYGYPPLTGKPVAVERHQRVIDILTAAHSQSKESHYRYQMKELLQILSSPDFQELCYANDECANIDAVARKLRSSQLSDLNESLDVKTSSLPSINTSNLPPDERPRNTSRKSENSVRIIQSQLPGCYAQIHFSDRDIPLKTVILEKGKQPLGATVRNEREAVVIGRIVMGGIASKSGLLKEGDELLSVNGVELTGRDVNEVADILARLSGTIQFTVASIDNKVSPSISRPVSGTRIQLRALFAYDPIDDPYMPCKDIGLKFDCGDILHVSNVQDPNWWQAYKDDEGQDTGSIGDLAGLIPSPDYQYQREMLRKQLLGDDDPSRQQSSIICLKKNKKNCPNSTNNGWVYNVDMNGKPSAAETNKRRQNRNNRSTYRPGELELNQIDPNINTYEEVQLFIPQPHRKRPIVLVGLEYIGKNDLVNMIVSSDPEQISVVKQHTTGDSKSNEYRLVSKEEFKHLQNQEEFLETAVFEKTWYGISKSEVKTIIDSGKTAVLVLQPESLQFIRKTNFIPYIIFIQPPHKIDTYRNLRMNLEKQRTPDDELIKTLSLVKEINKVYGHLFDRTLVIQSLDTAVHAIIDVIKELEISPQYVPSRWLGQR